MVDATAELALRETDKLRARIYSLGLGDFADLGRISSSVETEMAKFTELVTSMPKYLAAMHEYSFNVQQAWANEGLPGPLKASLPFQLQAGWAAGLIEGWNTGDCTAERALLARTWIEIIDEGVRLFRSGDAMTDLRRALTSNMHYAIDMAIYANCNTFERRGESEHPNGCIMLTRDRLVGGWADEGQPISWPLASIDRMRWGSAANDMTSILVTVDGYESEWALGTGGDIFASSLIEILRDVNPRAVRA